MNSHYPPFSFSRRYVFLLASLIGLFIILPVYETGRYDRLTGVIMQLCMSAVILTGVIANRQRRALFWTGCLLGGAAVVLQWMTSILQFPVVSFVGYLFLVVYFSFTAVMILVAVVKDHMATIQAVQGGVCAYLLMGLAWAFLYGALEYVEPDPLRFVNQRPLVEHRTTDGRLLTSPSQLVYYSFVTMSSVGFGDITPRTAYAEMLTWMEAVIGQLYLAVFIARAINLIPLSKM